MPYRKDTIFAPFAIARFLKEKGGAHTLQSDTARKFARVMDMIGMEIAHLAVMNAKKEGRMTVYSRDILNALKNGAWKEKFVHGQEVCSVCGQPGYVMIKVPKKTPRGVYAYAYVKHGFGSARQCIVGRVVNPLASRDGNGQVQPIPV